MQQFFTFCKKFRHWLICFGIALVCFAVSAAIWQSAVRPNSGKCFSVKICDDYPEFSTINETVSQTFSLTYDVMNLAFMFETVDGQPQGELELILQDAATDEILASSTGVMGNIISGQYTALGLDALADSGGAMRQYRVTLIPHYETDARLAIGHSAVVINEGETMALDGAFMDATLAQYVSSAPIGRFLNLFYWAVALALAIILCGTYLLCSAKKLRLSLITFVLVLAFGSVFSAALPPYAVPDEQFHINESFTVASWWANRVSGDEWVMRDVPIFYSYRRPGDFNSIMQEQKTTVFTWKEYAYHLTDTTTDKLGDHVWLFEAQADTYPLLYFFSALGVFLGFCLHLGFAPTLFLGRACNLLVFAALAAYGVKKTPVAKSAFFAVSLLPMTLHLAASFSRDSLLLGCCFVYTALCLDAAFGKTEALSLKQLIPIAVLGLIIAPAKVVYLPLIALCLLIPAARLGGKKRAVSGKCVFLVLCLCLVLWHNGYILQSSAVTDESQATVQDVNSQIQSEYQELLNQTGGESVIVESTGGAANTAGGAATEAADGESASVAVDDNRDSICFTLSYILAHPLDTIMLCVNSAIQLGEHYIKTLVGGNLSYYSLELSWGWVILLYGLLAFSSLCAPGQSRLAGAGRGVSALLALACCGLAILGCVCWTPTYYTTIYGLQGRYFLPVLPLILAALCPRFVEFKKDMTPALVLSFCAVDAGVLLNILLAVIAR